MIVGERGLGRSRRANGEVRFGVNLAAGKNALRLELVPDTFNAFGRHHYYGGDWRVISPDQIKGVRHFADPADAPVNTHVKAWHFRRFTLSAKCFDLAMKTARRFLARAILVYRETYAVFAGDEVVGAY